MSSSVFAAGYQAGESYFGRENYIEYRAGNLPVILTSGHGGHLRPDEIPDRTWGVTGTDRNTQQLTEAMAAEIFSRTGRHPHVIISHLHRIKLDPNREIVEAAQGSPHAEQAWGEFHGFIEDARVIAEAEFGFGFLVDVHGHGHTVQRLELGYGLGRVRLNRSDTQLEAPHEGWDSSLRTLMLRRPGVSFPEMLRGPRSLGALFNERGVPAWPSPEYPSPGDEPFFSGGYITRTHTCFVDNGPVNGFQLEAYFGGVRDTDANRQEFARVFARVIQPYLYDNYGYSIGTLPLYLMRGSGNDLQKGGSQAGFAVDRIGYRDFASEMALEFGGTAVRGVDYTTAGTPISFSSGQQRVFFSVVPLPPNGDLGDKTIEIRLAPTAVQTADTTPIVLTLGDGLSQTVRISPAGPEVSEAGGTAGFRLRRTSTVGDLAVNVAWDGSATPGRHFDFADELPSEVVFADGSATADVSVTLVNDAIAETDRRIILRVEPGENYVAGIPGEAEVRVVDNDRPDGLAVWYPGELSGNVLYDASGNGRHAALIPAGRGPVRMDTEERPTVRFDGVEAAAAVPRFPIGENDEFSIAFHFLIFPGSTMTRQNLISHGPRGGDGALNVYLSSSSNLRTWLSSDAGGHGSTALDVTGTWSGVWRHYTLTVADGTSRVYIDGELARTANGWVPPLNSREILWMGWRRGSTVEFFRGFMRDFRIYNRGLEAAEVASLASGRLTFDVWARSLGLPSGSLPTSDLSGNGRNLLLDYALGADPLSSNRPPRYQVGLGDEGLLMRFVRQAAAGDLAWTVEAADRPDLPWETIAHQPAGASEWSVAPGVVLEERDGLVEVGDSSGASDRPSRVIRLRVERDDY